MRTTSTASGDRIELRGLRAMGICGALAEERVRAQPLEVDVDIAADLSAAGASDRLADTVDYAGVVARLERVITSERFTLLERLAERLAETVLEDQRVVSVTVAVRKLRPPVPQQIATTGVRMARGR